MNDPARINRCGFASAGLSATAAASAEESRHVGTATVVRDTWGTPHVYADTRYALLYGYGFSVAEDRLFQVDMARRSSTGQVAEVLGVDYVDYDRSVRASIDCDSIRRQYDELEQEDRDVFEGYAAGVNARIREVLDDRGNLLPHQYLAADFEPAEWSSLDVVMIFVGTMVHRFSDTTNQAENLDTLRELVQQYGEQVGHELFDQIVWRDDPSAPTTVPAAQPESVELAPIAPTVQAEQASAPPLLLTPPSMPEGSASLAAAASHDSSEHTGTPRFSNAWLIAGSTTDSESAILVNGPQFGFFQPAYTYSVGLHGAGFDVVGNTPFGYPVVLFGHNEHIGWGSTAGMGTTVDLFAEQLNPQNQDEYRYQGTYRPFEHRTESIAVRDAEPVTVTTRWSVHGPVIRHEPSTGFAYSKQRTWAGRELESLLGWLHSTAATSWSEWLGHAERNALSINWYYADRGGNIGYAHTGTYPQRAHGVDPRLPMSGTGDMDWAGLRPFSTNPKVHNPAQGFLANWNNKPAAGYEGVEPWCAADRVREIEALLRERSDITPEQAWNIIRSTSFVDVNARYFIDDLHRAIADLPEESDPARAVRLIEQWDQHNLDHDGDGHYDHPGGTLLRAWLEQMVTRTLSDLPPGVRQRYAVTGYPESSKGTGLVHIGTGTQLVYNALRGSGCSIPQTHDLFAGREPYAVVRDALDAAIGDLRQRYGPDMSAWLHPALRTLFDHENFAGIPQADAGEDVTCGTFANRGSQNDIIVLGQNGITAAEVTAPGQSGFVAPDGSTGAHYRDQLDLFAAMQHKPAWFSRDDVLAHQESVRTLSPQ